MSSIVPSAENTATGLFQQAKNRYLDLNQPLPDIDDLADEIGIDRNRLYKVFLNEGWLRLRREMEERGSDVLQAAQTSLVQKWEQGVGEMLNEMFRRDLELIDSRKAVVVEYLDNLMLSGLLKGSDAINYWKILNEMEQSLRKITLDEKHRYEDRSEVIKQYHQTIQEKMAALEKITTISKKRSGETIEAKGETLTARRQRLKELT